MTTQTRANVPTRLGPYEVGPKVGGGGMATVFIGRKVDGTGDEVVALKLIKDELLDKPGYVEMFLDEAKILLRLSHPHIIETREAGIAEHARFIAMELLLGRTLMDAWEICAERESRVPLDLAAYIASCVADALQHAHTLIDAEGKPLRIIHRDVNPTNVFLTYDGRVKLIDFGLAKAEGRISQSAEGVVKGKVPYLSPEQIAEAPIDHRTDIYALGATLWEMTTGRRLFKRDNDLETIKAIRAQEIPDPRTIVDGIYPDALFRIVDKALKRDPNDRYASAAEMAVDLDAFALKHGRKTPMSDVLSGWLEELFPGERSKQEVWLDKVSHIKTNTRMTMRPPAPLAAVPSDGPSVSILEAEPAVEVLRVPALAATLPSAEAPVMPQPVKIPEPELVVTPAPEVPRAPEPVPKRDLAQATPPPSKTELSKTERSKSEPAKKEPAKELAPATEATPAPEAKPATSIGRAVVVFLLTIAALAAIAWYLGILRF
ncbi:MAG TPA: protein kinase [Polyangiaceae bacterium]